MGIIAFLILGLLAGAIAKAIAPGRDPGGIIVTMLIGVAGAIVGGFLAAAIFGAHPLDEFFDISTWLTAIAGSLILLAAYRADPARQRPAPPRRTPMKPPITVAAHQDGPGDRPPLKTTEKQPASPSTRSSHSGNPPSHARTSASPRDLRRAQGSARPGRDGHPPPAGRSTQRVRRLRRPVRELHAACAVRPDAATTPPRT